MMKIKHILFASALTLTNGMPLAAQDCTDIRGEWVTNIGATVRFETIDKETGLLGGTYYSVTPPSRPFPLTGFINLKATPVQGKHNAIPISFAVNFRTDGDMVSWTGICRMVDGKPVLETEDHIVMASASNRWVHVASNHDTIVPKQ